MSEALLSGPTNISKVDVAFQIPSYTIADDFTGVVGPLSDDETGSEVEFTAVKPAARDKGKRKAGEKVEWSDDADEGENAYERFKKRKSTKRKKMAATKKILNAKAKNVQADRRRGKEPAEASHKKEKVWGDLSDVDMIDEDIPEYFYARRNEFDANYQKLHEAGLKLPPRYNDIEFSDDERIADLKERPDFPASMEPSRPYEDVELPHSGGVIPASIAQYLRDYQVEGVAFLHELFVYQKGGILG